MLQERRELTAQSLRADIDWKYVNELTALIWVRILVHFIPQLASLRAEVAVSVCPNDQKIVEEGSNERVWQVRGWGCT
ncbi:hypothetical protein B0H16DRAFT_1374375, partial [Mycena metata]